jgi:hypothetical protein
MPPAEAADSRCGRASQRSLPCLRRLLEPLFAIRLTGRIGKGFSTHENLLLVLAPRQRFEPRTAAARSSRAGSTNGSRSSGGSSPGNDEVRLSGPRPAGPTDRVERLPVDAAQHHRGAPWVGQLPERPPDCPSGRDQAHAGRSRAWLRGRVVDRVLVPLSLRRRIGADLDRRIRLSPRQSLTTSRGPSSGGSSAKPDHSGVIEP